MYVLIGDHCGMSITPVPIVLTQGHKKDIVFFGIETLLTINCHVPARSPATKR
jgi:hypothetical protein